jgi:hypothetical protein
MEASIYIQQQQQQGQQQPQQAPYQTWGGGGAPMIPTQSAQTAPYQTWQQPMAALQEPQATAGQSAPPTSTIPYAEPDAVPNGAAEPARRAMGAPPSLVGAPPSMVSALPSLAPLGTYPAAPPRPPLDPMDTATRARALLQSTRSTVHERYQTAHEEHERRLALRPPAPEADPPPGWTPRPREQMQHQPQPEPEPAAGDPAFFGEASADDGSMVGATSMGVSRETGSGMAGAGSAQWMNWIGIPTKRAKGVAKAGDRTDDQWLKLENGVLRIFKDPYHSTVRLLRAVLCCQRCCRGAEAVSTDPRYTFVWARGCSPSLISRKKRLHFNECVASGGLA